MEALAFSLSLSFLIFTENNNNNKTVAVWQGFIGIKENNPCIAKHLAHNKYYNNNSVIQIHLLVSSKEVSEKICKLNFLVHI